MIICSSNNIDFIQGVIAYGNEPSITDWRIENSNGVLNILNSKSTTANLAVLEGGNINIYGNYNKNNRDVINDTSNYVLSTSNILINRIRNEINYTSNYVGSISIGSGGGSSQWITSNANIYYNAGNVGIGIANPSKKLHIYNDINTISNLELLVQNNPLMDSALNITIVGTTLTTDGNDKIIRFPYSGSSSTRDYTLTTTEELNVDILIVGGGGGGGGAYVGGGGGGGGYIYLQNLPLPIGTYSVKVGSGGTAGTSGTGGNGNNSSITGAITYIALGGGGGGGGSAGGVITGIGNNGGSGGGGSYRGVSVSQAAGGTSTQLSTYGYGTGGSGNIYGSPWTSGGGGGGASGTTNGSSSTGNSGLANSITGTSITYAGGGGGGVDGTSPSVGGSGGGGGGANQSGIATAAVQGTDGLGGGGGGSSVAASAKGGSGIIIIRYRKIVGYSSINFLRGSGIDFNRNYSVGNYGGEYKIISSKQGTNDATYFRIAGDGTMYNAQGTTNFTSASDKRVKENIEKASYNKCYENINKLELYRFNYIKDFNNINNDNKQLGFIAQEVREYFPKAVYSNNYYNDDVNIGNLLSIDVSQINYTLYGAVKKLIELNNEKEVRIKRLETLLNIEDTPIDTSNTLPTTSNIALDTSNIALDTSNIALDTQHYMNRYWQYLNGFTSNIALDTSNIALDTSNIALDTSNIALDTSNIAMDTSNI